MVDKAHIHPKAIVEPGTELGDRVIIGPYAVIGPQVVIEEGTHIGPHVVIEGYTRIGKNSIIHAGAVIGGKPQDYKFKDAASYVEIGNHTLIREYVTVHRSSEAGGKTVIGDHCLLMAYTHVAHDCQLGDHVVIINYTGLSGYVEVEEQAIVSGYVAIHQFVRIGKLAMVSAQSGLAKDVPPYMIVEGRPCVVRGLNSIGLRRAGISSNSRTNLKRAYRLLFLSGLNTSDALRQIKEEGDLGEEVSHLVSFIEGSKRGIHKSRREEETEALQIES